MSTAKALILRAWETRQGEKVSQRWELALKRGEEQGAYLINGAFLWATGKQVAPLRVHVPGQPIRRIYEIAPEEIERAIRECVKGSLTIGHEDLVRESAKLFGLKNSPATSEAINSLVQGMLERDVLRQEAGKIRRGSKF